MVARTPSTYTAYWVALAVAGQLNVRLGLWHKLAPFAGAVGLAMHAGVFVLKVTWAQPLSAGGEVQEDRTYAVYELFTLKAVELAGVPGTVPESVRPAGPEPGRPLVRISQS